MRFGEGEAVAVPLCRGGGCRDCWNSCAVDQRVLCAGQTGGGGCPGHGEGTRADHKVRRRHHGRHVEADALWVGVRVDWAVGKKRSRVGGKSRGWHQHVGNGQRGHCARGEGHATRGEGHAARGVARREEEVQAWRHKRENSVSD